MSIILKGIDLPERKDVMHHEKYIIHIYDYGEVYVGKELYDADRRLKGKEKYTQLIIDGVQAIQIPKGHGRLIDADLFKDMIRDSVPAYGIGVKIPTYGDMDIMDKIGFMPTILEAEGTDL